MSWRKQRESGKRLASRVTGVSVPGFGISWEPATPDAEVAHHVITFLEDRRALYAPHEVEIASHVVESIVRTREFLTQVIGAGGISDSLASSLRAMRAACREFLDTIGVPGDADALHVTHWRHGSIGLHDYMLNQALGKLRGLVGVHVALIATQYGLNVEPDLASIMPPPAE